VEEAWIDRGRGLAFSSFHFSYHILSFWSSMLSRIVKSAAEHESTDTFLDGN
jgi:hypothetical protein